MAEVIKKEFEINMNYTSGEVTSLWSSENRGINGKITCVTLDLVNHSISTHTGMVQARSVIQLYSRSGSNEQIIECDVKYTPNQKIQYEDLRRIYSGSKLVNNGICELELKIVSDNNLHGNVSGIITVSYTEDEGEQEADTKLALDQNALSDWMKKTTVGGSKGGISSSNQFPIDFTIEQSSGSQMVNFVIWTNKGITNDSIKKISISLNIDVRNNSSSQRTLDFEFKAAYGSDSYSDTAGMWTLQADTLRNIKTAKTYEVDVLPNDGFCLITLNIKTAKEISGNITGVVIIDGVSQNMAINDEEGDGSSDSVIQNIMSILNDDGYGVSGGTSGTGVETDSFMSAYTKPGYEQDISNLLSENYKQSAMSDEMANRVLELEQRLTKLEERMSLLGVGGNEIDWYDGGNTGLDDPWGVDDWYTKTESRISQSENETQTGYTLFRDSTNPTNVFYEEEILTTKQVTSVNYNLLLSYRYMGTLCNGLSFGICFDNGNGINKYVDNIVLKNQENIITKEFNGLIAGDEPLFGDIQNIRASFRYVGELTSEQFNDLFENFVGKISGSVVCQLQDKPNEEKAKDKDELEIAIDMQNFNGSQTVFSYDAQSNNQVLQKVEISLAFDYKYDVSQSQLCVGQLLRLDFNTVAAHPGFADELTSFTIGQENISDSAKSSKQRVYKATYSTKSFANNGNCAFKIDFSTPGITSAKLNDLKQYFTGNVTGTIKYTTVSK